MTERPLQFHLGVTGHRHLSTLGHGPRRFLDARVFQLLDVLKKNLPANRAPVLVTPLAEGADRIVAWQARATGYELQVLLPFPSEEYEHDFESDVSVAEFRDLASLAADTRVLPAEDPSSPHRSRAYEAVGDALVATSDAVLALWDGNPEKGRGGTGQVVRRAVRRGVAVLHMDSEAPHDVHVYMREDLDLPRGIDGLTQALGFQRRALQAPS